MIRIPKKVSNRFVKQVGSFQKILKDARDRDVNESDTVTIIADILADIFGFDKYTEITSELMIKGTFCDLAIKVDGKIHYIIEVKAIGINLKESHLRQAVNYGANHGIPWIILTNGIDWKIYKIKFEQPISSDLLCSIDFTEINPRREDDQEYLFLLSKEGLDKAAIEVFHEHIQSVNRFAIGAVVCSKPVINLIRREVSRISKGIKVSKDEIENILRTEVLKRDIVEGEAVDEALNRIKKANRKTKKTRSIIPKIEKISEENTKF